MGHQLPSSILRYKNYHPTVQKRSLQFRKGFPFPFWEFVPSPFLPTSHIMRVFPSFIKYFLSRFWESFPPSFSDCFLLLFSEHRKKTLWEWRRVFICSILWVLPSSILRVFPFSVLKVFLPFILRVFPSSGRRLFLSIILRVFPSSVLKVFPPSILRAKKVFPSCRPVTWQPPGTNYSFIHTTESSWLYSSMHSSGHFGLILKVTIIWAAELFL